MRTAVSPTPASARWFLLGALVAAGSGPTLAQSPDHLQAMKQAGAAKAAIATNPPYAYPAPDGEPKGYMIDVATAAFKELGVPKVTAVTMTYDAMIPGLQARQFDFVPAGLNITAARCQVVVFTAPVTAQQDAMYTPPGNPKKIVSYAFVAQHPEIRLAALTGSTQEQYALKVGVKAEQIVRVPDPQAGISAVLGGRADALALGQFSVPNTSQRGVDMTVDKQSPVLGTGFAFRKEDVKTRDLVSAQINQMRANGKLQELYVKHGFTTWDVLAKLSKPADVVPGCD